MVDQNVCCVENNSFICVWYMELYCIVMLNDVNFNFSNNVGEISENNYHYINESQELLLRKLV